MDCRLRSLRQVCAPAGFLHVVAAVVRDPEGRCLIAQRPRPKDHGGKWEFPGGKLEVGEMPVEALARELWEELGIQLQVAKPLIQVPYRYRQRAVWLDVWEVERFSGEPHGREGQPVRWVAPARLQAYAFPAANLPVLTALRLPPYLLVTPEPGADWELFLRGLDRALDGGVRLVQLRAHSLDMRRYRPLAAQVIEHCARAGAACLLNAPAHWITELGAQGVHLHRHALARATGRPLPRDLWVSASVHNGRELAQAARIGVDFALVSPVLPTPSHPGASGLGWEGFEVLARRAPMPVYALGGVAPTDLNRVRLSGGQGVAAVRALWPGP